MTTDNIKIVQDHLSAAQMPLAEAASELEYLRKLKNCIKEEMGIRSYEDPSIDTVCAFMRQTSTEWLRCFKKNVGEALELCPDTMTIDQAADRAKFLTALEGKIRKGLKIPNTIAISLDHLLVQLSVMRDDTENREADKAEMKELRIFKCAVANRLAIHTNGCGTGTTVLTDTVAALADVKELACRDLGVATNASCTVVNRGLEDRIRLAKRYEGIIRDLRTKGLIGEDAAVIGDMYQIMDGSLTRAENVRRVKAVLDEQGIATGSGIDDLVAAVRVVVSRAVKFSAVEREVANNDLIPGIDGVETVVRVMAQGWKGLQRKASELVMLQAKAATMEHVIKGIESAMMDEGFAVGSDGDALISAVRHIAKATTRRDHDGFVVDAIMANMGAVGMPCQRTNVSDRVKVCIDYFKEHSGNLLAGSVTETIAIELEAAGFNGGIMGVREALARLAKYNVDSKLLGEVKAVLRNSTIKFSAADSNPHHQIKDLCAQYLHTLHTRDEYERTARRHEQLLDDFRSRGLGGSPEMIMASVCDILGERATKNAEICGLKTQVELLKCEKDKLLAPGTSINEVEELRTRAEKAERCFDDCCATFREIEQLARGLGFGALSARQYAHVMAEDIKRRRTELGAAIARAEKAEATVAEWAAGIDRCTPSLMREDYGRFTFFDGVGHALQDLTLVKRNVRILETRLKNSEDKVIKLEGCLRRFDDRVNRAREALAGAGET